MSNYTRETNCISSMTSMPPVIDYPFVIAPLLSVKGENLRGRSALSKETGPYVGAN